MTQSTLQAHRIETTLGEGGRLILEDLPFAAGQAVEVIVLPRAVDARDENKYPLRGKPLVYEDPFEPAVPPDDWDALR